MEYVILKESFQVPAFSVLVDDTNPLYCIYKSPMGKNYTETRFLKTDIEANPDWFVDKRAWMELSPVEKQNFVSALEKIGLPQAHATLILKEGQSKSRYNIPSQQDWRRERVEQLKKAMFQNGEELKEHSHWLSFTEAATGQITETRYLAGQ